MRRGKKCRDITVHSISYIFKIFLGLFCHCFPKLNFGTSKFEFLGSKSGWGPIIPQNEGAAKPPLQFTLYLPLLGGTYVGRTICLKNPNKNQNNKIVHVEL